MATYVAGNGASGGTGGGVQDMVKRIPPGRDGSLSWTWCSTTPPRATRPDPTLSFRGLDNSIYYLLEPADKSRYTNYSGCGNTLNCNHPVVRNFIRNCLRYWVVEMHVDGFRFDLASILGRDQRRRILEQCAAVGEYRRGPYPATRQNYRRGLGCGRAYQVGSFHGERWSEWNGGSAMMSAVLAAQASVGRNGLATRITGSSDLYRASGSPPATRSTLSPCTMASR